MVAEKLKEIQQSAYLWSASQTLGPWNYCCSFRLMLRSYQWKWRFCDYSQTDDTLHIFIYYYLYTTTLITGNIHQITAAMHLSICPMSKRAKLQDRHKSYSIDSIEEKSGHISAVQGKLNLW